MRWRGRRQSDNIHDARGQGGVPRMGRGGGPFVIRRAGGGGIGFIIVIFIVMMLFGINPLELLQGGGTLPGGTVPGQQTETAPTQSVGETDEMSAFVATVLAETEDVWKAIFADLGLQYEEPRLVLFSDSYQSGCGSATAATGPFYCPVDKSIYIDLSFYAELRSRFQAPGDFAQAYVLAHEVGHHVQNLFGILPQYQRERASVSEQEGNRMSIRVELQADCFAGVWANHTATRGLLEEGDAEEAIGAASAVGDDMIQKRTQGYVVPDSFNHGTAEQRVQWYRAGFASGDIDSCDTSGAV